jgi:diadenylate cyclase
MPLDVINLALRFRYIKNLGNTIVDYFSQVKGLFATFGIIDAVDILFVALVFYFIIRIIRETRAISLIKSIVLLAIVYFVVSFLGMGASSYIFKTIFSNILIIVFVLFSPEIRNVLEQMGKGAARNSIRAIIHSGVGLEIAETQKCIDAICKACNDMSDDKCGALIVLENETMLGDIIQTGTIIDAKPSKELIENIFYPKSPLHDGAMIIRGGNVYAAGCILPLTKDNDILSSLGTRHRAGIGISQQSDAIVIIVSEETGYISIAQNGNLSYNVSSGVVRDVLAGQFIPQGNSSDDKIIKKLVRRIKK